MMTTFPPETADAVLDVLDEALRRLRATNGERARTLHKYQARDVIWTLMGEIRDHGGAGH